MRRTNVLPKLEERGAETIRRDLQHRDRATRNALFSDAQVARDLQGKETVTITSAGTTLYHSLGREPAGYLVISQSTAASFFFVSQTKTSITLTSSVAAVLAKVAVI